MNMENDKNLKTQKQDKSLVTIGGGFKMGVLSFVILLIGYVFVLCNNKITYIFMSSGILGFVGMVAGMGELTEIILKREITHKFKLGYVLIGIFLNAIVWVGSIVLFLHCGDNALNAG